ncbi:MAG: Kynurenine formamidase [Chlamydiia bacterium]|nr:Kynurenine formamidase [Chlamydiia bacterium]
MFENAKFIDLTHTIDSSIPTWTGSCGFKYDVKKDYDDGIRVLKYEMHGACGTHMDAPSHFMRDGKNIADIPLEELFTPCVVIDVSKKRKEDLFIAPEDIKEYEASFGKIPKNALVVGFTGWQEFWSDPIKYRNPKDGGGLSFPGFSKESAELLVERGIAGIGIDTLSPDGSNQDTFPVHHTILGEGKFILENMVNLHKLPPRGASIVTLPIKIGPGTEAAVRSVGIVQT